MEKSFESETPAPIPEPGKDVGLRACPECGREIRTNSSVCPDCGHPLMVDNGVATASLVLGIQSLAGCILLSVIPARILEHIASSVSAMKACLLFGTLSLAGFIVLSVVPAIILGHTALFKIRKSPMPMKGRRRAIGGLVFAYGNVILIMVIAIPNLLNYKIQRNEAAAIYHLHTLTGAQTGYSGSGGNYAASLAELTDSTNGPAFLLGEWWGEGVPKEGYIFGMTDESGNGSCYESTASPAIPGRTGVRYFFSDCSGVIRANAGRPADSTSTPLGEEARP